MGEEETYGEPVGEDDEEVVQCSLERVGTDDSNDSVYDHTSSVPARRARGLWDSQMMEPRRTKKILGILCANFPSAWKATPPRQCYSHSETR